jgi:hypothetical protein
MKLAILALIGSSSAIQFSRNSGKWERYTLAQQQDRFNMSLAQQRVHEPYSNEIANGDVSDDKQIVDIDNAKYDMADDYGFVNAWKRDGSPGLH